MGFGISAALLLSAVTVSTCVSPPPAVMPLRFTVCAPASSRIAAGSGMASSVGGSLSPDTTTVNVRDTVPLSPGVPRLLSRPPSVTVTVMIALPETLASGV